MSNQIAPKTKRTAEADTHFQPPQAPSQTSNPHAINSITRYTHSHRIAQIHTRPTRIAPHRATLLRSTLLKWCFMTLDELEREYSSLRQQSDAVRSYL
jgi:hypothetical protein